MDFKDNEYEKKRLYKHAENIMMNLRANERHFTAIQLIRSHSTKNRLGELVELLDDTKVKKAQRLLCKIEIELVSIFQENLRK